MFGWFVCLFDGYDQSVFGRFFLISVCPNLCREDGDDILMRARSLFSGGNDSNAVPKGGASLMANDGGGRRSRRRRCGIVVVLVVVVVVVVGKSSVAHFFVAVLDCFSPSPSLCSFFCFAATSLHASGLRLLNVCTFGGATTKIR